MPMLTPLPSLGAGAPASPKSEPNAIPTSSAQAAGGESREGNSTNTQPSTWTRLFQSLLTQNQDTDSPTAPGGGASTRKKAKDGSSSSTPSPTAGTPTLQATIAALPIVQPPIASVPLVQPVSSSPKESATPTTPAPAQPVASPIANTPPLPTAIPAAIPAATPAITEDTPAPAATLASETPVAPASMPAPASENAEVSTPAQPGAASQTGFAIPNNILSQAAATTPPASPLATNATQPAAVAQLSQAAIATQAPAIESLAATVAPSVTPSGIKPAAAYTTPAAAAKNPTPAATSASSANQTQSRAAASLTDRLAATVVSVSQTTPAAPTSAAAPQISQIAQDDRTLGPETATQATRQGGRPLISEANAAPVQSSAPAPASNGTTQAQPAGLQASDQSHHAHESAATAQTKAKSAASGSAQTQSAFATAGTATPAQTATATNAQLVQSSSQAERIGVINQIANQVAAAGPSAGASSTINVSLHPEHWGPVNISITTTPAQASSANPDAKSVVAATIVSTDPSVREALKSHVQDLSNALTGAGFHVDKLEVAAQATTASSAGQGSSAFHQGQNSGSSSGYLANQQGMSAQTGGDSNRQNQSFNQSFSAAFGQSQGGNQGGGNNPSSQQVSMQQEGDDPVAPTAPAMRRGLVDYRI